MLHHLPPKNLDLRDALHHERHLLTRSQVPIVTVSATFRKELLKKFPVLTRIHSEAVFSRAHYSMAEAIHQTALNTKLTTHLSDPTNFVGSKDWSKIAFTQKVGQILARYPTLKKIKDQIDQIARSNLPITEPITPPLLYLTERIKHPIVSMHYEVGNILYKSGKTVIQAVTDPHVRPQYLDALRPVANNTSQIANGHKLLATRHALYYTVFDSDTKKSLLTLAKYLGKQITSEQVIITGPPIDPRITKLSKLRRKITPGQPINLAITTGGIGTNLAEIKSVLRQLAPLLKPPEKIRLFLHAGTHRDFRNFFEDFAGFYNIRIGNLDDANARIRILYEDSIIDANENLIQYMFPWAHGVITKPSGDMAYDAAAAGCFLLFLEPWGPWEENVQDIFLKNKVGFDLSVNKAHQQISYFINHNYFSKAINKAKNLPPIYRNGSKNIVRLHQQITKTLAHDL